MKRTLRLDKALANMGFGTRSEIRKRLKKGEVAVNGDIVKDGAVHIQPDVDHVLIDGVPFVYRQHIYLMMNKPAGVISATEDVRTRTVIDLLDEKWKHFQPFPVGRLDKDTVGLLLLSNDGRLAHNLLSPRKEVEKVYEVEVDGPIDERVADTFRRGVMLDDGYVTMPAELKVVESTPTASRGELIIKEGKFHQVKRMFLAVGRTVTFLKRVRMGPLSLDPRLQPGEYRELSESEWAALDRL